ncbi:MAG: TrbI/VirB10 family protein [Gammaproteobacteria bacterium]
MAGKLQNLGAALKDSKTRVLIVVVLIIVIIGFAIGWLGLKKTRQPTGAVGAAAVSGPPSIRATPGVGTPSQEYVKRVQQSDILAAQEAAREKKSAIATLTRGAYIAGEGPQQLPGIPGAAATKIGCSVEELQRARRAGVRAEEIRASSGCDAAALRAAGYTAGELLNAGFNAKELRAAGFSAKELKDAGFSAAELKEAGFTAGELAAAGFSAGELSQIGFSADELTAAGINVKAISKTKDCSVTALREARRKGVPASQLRDRGCDAKALRLAGFTAQELRDAGFSAGELLRAGYSVSDLKNAGFDANDLRNAGAKPGELAAAGFQVNQLESVGFTQGDISRAGVVAPAAYPAANFPTNVTPAAIVMPAQPQELTAIPATPGEASLQALHQLQQRQAAQLSEQERLQTIQRMQETMQGQVADLFASWSPPNQQQYVEGKPLAELAAGAVGAGAAGGKAGQGGAQAGLAGAAGGPLIKAGCILFATLDTSLNSDEPGPVLATIVQNGGHGCNSGFDNLDLKGARLLGSFRRENKRVLLTFNTISIPTLFPASSQTISAVAIDPNTARTALASNVNSHYLLRYGTLLGSSFISGLGQVTMQSGSQIQNTIFSSTVTTASLSAGEKALVALGQAGQQLGAATASFFNTPPTVTLKSGSTLGILFMADATLDSLPPPAAVPQRPEVAQSPSAFQSFRPPENPDAPLMEPPNGPPPPSAAPAVPFATGFPPAAQQSTTQTTSVQTSAIQPTPPSSPPQQPSRTSPAPYFPYRE